MKTTLKTSLRKLATILFVSACLATIAQAQNREEHFISANAGGVNLTSGDVMVRRAGTDDWRTLSVKDDLKSGDAVRVGAWGRVEVLLNPGSYFRARAGAEFEFVSTSLIGLHLRLSRGSAVVEAAGYDGLDLNFAVSTPQTQVRIVRAGVYRIDASGETVVAVRKGRAVVGADGKGIVVKGDKVARVGADGAVEIAKLDKKQSDPLDEWSRVRGKELAKMNEGLANRQASALMRASFDRLSNGVFSSSFGNTGLWFWVPSMRCYTFLPFSDSWSSPYGIGYSSWYINSYGYPCGSCSQQNHVPLGRGGNPNGGYTPGTTVGRGGSGTTGGGPTPTGGTPQPAPAPPMPSSPPVTFERGERPTRERTIEPGSRP